jgi:DeoR family transcriptional regulator, fructose operon transcriptional repressor
MYAEERQQEILQRARSQGRVDVETLAAGFDVSAETIRRDLTTLAHAGHVRRVHGGAIPTERLTFELALSERDLLMTAEKEAIAKRALDELPSEGAIIVDAGSTTGRFAQILPHHRQLTVITNAIGIAMAVGPREDLTVHLLGGRLRPTTLATVDDWSVRAVRELRADVAFIATNGLSAEAGLTTPDLAEAATKRALIASARRVVVLADHTKIGEEYFAQFGALSDIDLVITDSGLDDAAAAELTHAGLDVVRAGTRQDQGKRN